MTWRRAELHRVDVVDDRAAVLAEELLISHAGPPARRHAGTAGSGGDQPVAGQRELLLVLAALDLVRDALDEVQAVERGASAADADESRGRCSGWP